MWYRVVDISDNKIDEDQKLIEQILCKIPKLRVLYLFNNECVRKIPYYRKNVVGSLKELTYLDDKPVFEDERRYCDAFIRGGIEEERRERVKYKQEKIDAENQRLQDFRELVETWKKEKNVPTDEVQEQEQKKEDEKKKKDEEKQKMMEKCLKLKSEKGKAKKIVIEEECDDGVEIEVNTKTDKSKSNANDSHKNNQDEFFLTNENPVINQMIKEETDKNEIKPFVKDNNIFENDEFDDIPQLERVNKYDEIIKSAEEKDSKIPLNNMSVSEDISFTEKIKYNENKFEDVKSNNKVDEEISKNNSNLVTTEEREKNEKIKEEAPRSKGFFEEVD